jgi:membrane protein implicated in regulation of membrane protease activity
MGAHLLLAWWVWLSAAAVLGILEVIIPAFVFLGFALGAVATGALLAIGIVTMTASWTLVVFALLSLVAYIGLRAVFGGHSGQVKRIDRDINEN